MTLAEALSIIERDAGQHFDPLVVAVFIKIAPGFVHARGGYGLTMRCGRECACCFPAISKQKRPPKKEPLS